MNNTGRIEIALSKTKLTKLLMISLAFVAAGAWILIAQISTSNPFFNNPIIKNGAAVAAILLGLLGAITAVKKLLDNKPGLIIDDTGITDNSSAVAAGHIPWSDIHLITTSTVVNQKFLLLMVKNPEGYINRQTNVIKRKGMRYNLKNYGSPVSISANGLKCTLEELEGMIEERLAGHKGKREVIS